MNPIPSEHELFTDKARIKREIDKFYDRIVVTEEESQKILKGPQRGDEWKKHRSERLTASNGGSSIEHGYETPQQTLVQKVWNTFGGNEATEYGNINEDAARSMSHVLIQKKLCDANYVEQVILPAYGRQKLGAPVCTPKVSIVDIGLYVNPEYPWLGASSDGIVYMTFSDGTQEKATLEIKCPWAAGKKTLYREQTKTEHYVQVTMAMKLLSLPLAFYVQYTPTHTKMQTIEFDKKYWDAIEGRTKYFWCCMAYNMILKENNLLLYGQVRTLDPSVLE